MSLTHPVALPLPTELEVLELLWCHDALSAKEVYGVLSARRHTSYRTVKTILALMQGKGLLEKQSLVRPARYRAVYSRSETQQFALSQVAALLFQGDMTRVFRAVLSHPGLGPDHQNASGTISKQLN
jgi:predicted transcriptional regulator